MAQPGFDKKYFMTILLDVLAGKMTGFDEIEKRLKEISKPITKQEITPEISTKALDEVLPKVQVSYKKLEELATKTAKNTGTKTREAVEQVIQNISGFSHELKAATENSWEQVKAVTKTQYNQLLNKYKNKPAMLEALGIGGSTGRVAQEIRKITEAYTLAQEKVTFTKKGKADQKVLKDQADQLLLMSENMGGLVQNSDKYKRKLQEIRDENQLVAKVEADRATTLRRIQAPERLFKFKTGSDALAIPKDELLAEIDLKIKKLRDLEAKLGKGISGKMKSQIRSYVTQLSDFRTEVSNLAASQERRPLNQMLPTFNKESVDTVEHMIDRLRKLREEARQISELKIQLKTAAPEDIPKIKKVIKGLQANLEGVDTKALQLIDFDALERGLQGVVKDSQEFKNALEKYINAPLDVTEEELRQFEKIAKQTAKTTSEDVNKYFKSAKVLNPNEFMKSYRSFMKGMQQDQLVKIFPFDIQGLDAETSTKFTQQMAGLVKAVDNVGNSIATSAEAAKAKFVKAFDLSDVNVSKQIIQGMGLDKGVTNSIVNQLERIGERGANALDKSQQKIANAAGDLTENIQKMLAEEFKNVRTPEEFMQKMPAMLERITGYITEFNETTQKETADTIVFLEKERAAIERLKAEAADVRTGMLEEQQGRADQTRTQQNIAQQEERIKKAKQYQQQLQEVLKVTNQFAGQKGITKLARDFDNLQIKTQSVIDTMGAKAGQAVGFLKGMKFDPQGGKSFETFAEKIKQQSLAIRERFIVDADRITNSLKENIAEAERLATKIARVKSQAAQAMARAVEGGRDDVAQAIAQRSTKTLNSLNAGQEALLTQRKGFVSEMNMLGSLAAAENQKMIQTTSGDAKAASKEYEKMGTGVKKHTMTMMSALGKFRDFWRRLRFIFFDIRMAIYGFGLTFLARNIIRFGSEVEYQLNIVASVANATNDQLKELTNTAEYMGRTSIFNTEQVSKGMYDLASAGLSVDQMLGVLNPAMKFAVINGENFEKSNRLIAMTMKQFGIGTQGVSKMVDIFTESIFSSQETMDKLMEGMKYAGPTGASFNQSLSSVVATLSAFVDLGYQGGHSGRYYRRALLELNDAIVKHSSVIRAMGVSIDEISPTTNDFGAILKRLANTQMDMTQAVLLFGSQAGPAIMNVIQAYREGRTDVEAYAKQLESSTGRVERAYDRQIKTAKGMTQLMQAAWGGLQIELFKRYEQNLKSAAKWLLDLATDTQTWVMAGKGIAIIEKVMNGVLFVLKQIVKYTPAILMMLGAMLIQFKGIGSLPIIGKILEPLLGWFKSMSGILSAGPFLSRFLGFMYILKDIAKFTLPFAVTFLVEQIFALKNAIDLLEESYQQMRDATDGIRFAQNKASTAITQFNTQTGQHLTNLKDVNKAATELGLTWNVITKTWVTAEKQLTSFDNMVKKSADDFGKAEAKYQKGAINIDKALKELTGAYNVADLGKEPEWKFPAVEMAKTDEERTKALEDVNRKQKAALQHNLENLNAWADENKKIYQDATAGINAEMAKRLEMLNTEESIAARRAYVQKELADELAQYEKQIDQQLQNKMQSTIMPGGIEVNNAAEIAAEKQALMAKKRAELQAQEEIRVTKMTTEKVKQFAKEKAAAQEKENIRYNQSNAKSNEQLRKVWEERYKILKGSLDEQTKLYQDYVKKITDAEKELFNIKKEGAAALRDLDREGMGELAQYEDKRSEIQELISQAQTLAAQGTEESIKQAQEMFKNALSLARGMNQEVKDADNNILVSKETVLQESKDAIGQIVAAQTRAQQAYIDVLNQSATKTAENVTKMRDEMQTIQDKWLGVSKMIEENPINVKFKADDVSFSEVKKKIEDLGKTEVTIKYKAELKPQGAQKAPGAGGEGEEDTEAGVVTTDVQANTQPAEDQINNFEQNVESTPIVKDVQVNVQQGNAGSYSRGGKIRGFGGGDVVPAWLEPGEWIMKKEAVRKYGANLMNAINRMSFNTGYNPTPWENLMESMETRSNKSLQFAEGGLVPDGGDTTHVVLDFKGGKKVSLQGKKDMVNELVNQLRRERLTSLHVN
jgi:TP901 family phage tail tape measure protein